MRKFKSKSVIILPIMLSLIVVLPLLFLAAGSLMSELELGELIGPVLGDKVGYATWHWLPHFPTLRPYVELLLDSPGFFVMFWNSVKLAGGVLLGQLFVAAPAAWYFARSRRRFSRGVFTLYIVLMLMPFQVTMVSNYIVLDQVGMLDSHWGVLLPAVFSSFPVFIMYRFFKGVPTAIIEAAEIDGASDFQVFLHIGIPMSKAGIACAMVLGFLEYWNLIEQPMVFLKTKSLWPLSLFLPHVTSGRAGIALAASVVTLLPSLLVFLLGQSYLEQGITASGLKE